MSFSKKTKENNEEKEPVKGYIISSIILGVAIAIALFVTIQTLAFGYTNFFGYSVFRVVTGSMEPTIPVNAVLVCKKTAADQIQTGDIICFKSRESSHYGVIVTHRVVDIREDESGKLHLESRGDANYSSDPYYVTDENLIGKVIWFTGREGVLTGMLSFVSGQFGFLALVVFPVLLIAGFILQAIGRNIKGELGTALENLATTERKRAKKRTFEDLEAERREMQIPEEDLLPGFKTITKADYEMIYQSLKNELQKELKDRAKGSEAKTEYEEEDV